MRTSEITRGVAVAATFVAVSAALAIGRRMHMVTEDASLRATLTLTGLVLLVYANAIPKAVFATARAQRLHRISGWAFALAGAGLAAAWAFAPLPVATGAMALPALALVLVGVLCMRSPRGDIAS